ncbi:50S ribosomal protein L3 [Candidatus Falkowbacteria bacterium]|jgi:large subunit ribosomal protein L3|nr:50S ribosomal protein L3 [Candidatus Falkowbacteria bacterium]
MKFILGKKLSMTQVWSGDKVAAVTPVLAGPCIVAQVKTKAKDGYEAVQLAFGNKKEKNINKPQIGHVKDLNIKPAHLKEFRVDDASTFKKGDVITVETFAAGDIINVTGISKGKGFQGVVKRHGFGGFRKTHGNKDQERMSGAIGPKGPARVFKGTKMGGRMGGDRITITNLEVVSVDGDKGIVYVKGAIPGAVNSLIMITGKGDIKLNIKKEVVVETSSEAEEVKGAEEVKELKEEKEESKEEVKAEANSEVKEEKKEETKEEVKAEVAATESKEQAQSK